MTTSAQREEHAREVVGELLVGGAVRAPGNERLKLAPEGQLRVFAFDAAGERTGMMITRPETCSGCSSCSSRSAAT